MRGHDEQTTHMFSYLSPEQRVPANHPLRAVRALTDEALHTMSRRFAGLYATTGRPSIPPEQLLRALLLQVLYTVRSERLLMEELNYNLLFRWFVGLSMDDPVWHPTTFTKNRDRLLAGEIAAAFFEAVQTNAREAGLLSYEHFTVDGTQLEAWANPTGQTQADPDIRQASGARSVIPVIVPAAERGRCRDRMHREPPDLPRGPEPCPHCSDQGLSFAGHGSQCRFTLVRIPAMWTPGHPKGRSEAEDGGAVDALGLRRLSVVFSELMGETPSTIIRPNARFFCFLSVLSTVTTLIFEPVSGCFERSASGPLRLFWCFSGVWDDFQQRGRSPYLYVAI